jgi:hypothetical protein
MRPDRAARRTPSVASSEKHDMKLPVWNDPQPLPAAVAERERGLDGDEFARIIFELLWSEGAFGAGGGDDQRPLACVWSELDGCTCRELIPQSAVAAAWRRELDATGVEHDRLFHFIWEGGVWLAYGLAGGRVRGVHCPAHNSERAARSREAIVGDGFGAGAIVCELELAA